MSPLSKKTGKSGGSHTAADKKRRAVIALSLCLCCGILLYTAFAATPTPALHAFHVLEKHGYGAEHDDLHEHLHKEHALSDVNHADGHYDPQMLKLMHKALHYDEANHGKGGNLSSHVQSAQGSEAKKKLQALHDLHAKHELGEHELGEAHDKLHAHLHEHHSMDDHSDRHYSKEKLEMLHKKLHAENLTLVDSKGRTKVIKPHANIKDGLHDSHEKHALTESKGAQHDALHNHLHNEHGLDDHAQAHADPAKLKQLHIKLHRAEEHPHNKIKDDIHRDHEKHDIAGEHGEKHNRLHEHLHDDHALEAHAEHHDNPQELEKLHVNLHQNGKHPHDIRFDELHQAHLPHNLGEIQGKAVKIIEQALHDHLHDQHGIDDHAAGHEDPEVLKRLHDAWHKKAIQLGHESHELINDKFHKKFFSKKN